MTDQRTISPVGALSTRASAGQLFVYVTLLPGRLVPQAQAVQKKKALRACWRWGSVSALAGSA